MHPGTIAPLNIASSQLHCIPSIFCLSYNEQVILKHKVVMIQSKNNGLMLFFLCILPTGYQTVQV